MPGALTRCNGGIAFLLFFLSCIAYTVNTLFFQYPGNDYLPPHSEFIGIILALMYGGMLLQFGRIHPLTQIIKEIIYYFLVICLLAFATYAAQFTPFSPIDAIIINFETNLHINIPTILEWTHAHPGFATLLIWIYGSLAQQMTFLPLIVIAAGRFQLIRQYYFILLMSACMGFTLYFFFPTTAPASWLDSVFFAEEQRATGLKFYEIHHYIQPSTLEGGMVALPSFHVIWAWACTYLLHPWKIFFILTAMINCLLVLSCVLLGWHYPTDIAASVIIIMFTHFLMRQCIKKSTNA